MDIKFDAHAAKQLINDMDKYCMSISKNTRSLRMLMRDDRGWEDGQSKAFKANLDSISQDLNNVLRLESEYMKLYEQRVKELSR